LTKYILNGILYPDFYASNFKIAAFKVFKLHKSVGQPKLLKEINNNHVLNLLVQNRQISRAQLAKLTGLSRATISMLVDELIEIGLVSEAGQGSSSGGRPPIILQFNPNTAYALGAHMQDNEWTVVATNLDGTIIHSLGSPIPQNSPEQAVNTLSFLVQQIISQAAGAPILPAIGIGSPGLVDISSGTIQSAVDIGWFQVPLAKLIQEKLGLPAYVVNRSKGGALAEMWSGGVNRNQDLIYISIGTGVAAGILHQGQLYHGANSSAGELGHVTIIPDGPACPCGNHGCLQQLISEHALAARAREKLKSGMPSSLYALAGHHPERLTAYDVIDAAEEGDSLACEVIDTAAEYLAIAVGNLINLFNPEKIVIGGPVGNRSRRLATSLQEKASYRAMAYPLSAVHISTSTLGEQAGAIGAAVLVLQNAHQLLFQLSPTAAPSAKPTTSAATASVSTTPTARQT